MLSRGEPEAMCFAGAVVDGTSETSIISRTVRLGDDVSAISGAGASLYARLVASMRDTDRGPFRVSSTSFGFSDEDNPEAFRKTWGAELWSQLV